MSRDGQQLTSYSSPKPSPEPKNPTTFGHVEDPGPVVAPWGAAPMNALVPKPLGRDFCGITKSPAFA